MTTSGFYTNRNGVVIHDRPCDSRAAVMSVDGNWRVYCRECPAEPSTLLSAVDLREYGDSPQQITYQEAILDGADPMEPDYGD